MHLVTHRLVFAVLAACLLATPAVGDTVKSAMQRMQDRLEQIDQMKSEGTVGENAEGFLSMRSSLGPRQASLVEEENADRLIVYSHVAKSTGQSVEAVGRQRAIRLFELTKAGFWLRKASGDWIQKS